MQPTTQSIADEVESAISLSSSQKALETARRVTDFFASSANLFKDDQIEVFGSVLERLIKTLELRALADIGFPIALAEMSTQLAPLSLAPKSARDSAAEFLEASVQELSRAPHRRRPPLELAVPRVTKSTAHLPHLDGLAGGL
ncbi:MAG: hypothetical protein ACREDL_17260 [Bradyrhizobium sp.]